MTIVWSLGIVLGVIVLITLGYYLSLFWKNRKPKGKKPGKEPGDNEPGFWKDYWESGVWLPVIVAVFLIDTIIWNLWSGCKDFVYGNFGSIIFLHIVFLVGGSMLPRNPVLLKRRVARILLAFGAVASIALIGNHLKWWSGTGEVPTVIARVFARGGTTSGSSGYLRESAQGEITTRRFWNESGLPQYQADAMIEHARRESGYNQFRPDGSVYRNPSSSAMGKNQILESLWSKDAQEQNLDLATEEGNDAFALWLVKKRVSEGKRFDIDWDATSPRKVIEVLAPLEPEWSEEITIPFGGSFNIDKGHLLRFFVNKGLPDQHIAEPEKNDPSGYVPLGDNVKSIAIQSREATAVIVTVRR